ncbi:hypothetical protein FE697_011855 [Mumia zhuanghuii]|uniref:Uncharacterized protein n=2 Tax=Mumia TaxID=1546255 RepID=A0ABW1QGT1_9ACTN|nr:MULTISPECIES: hypothetical protein [Mumia]KAA1422840.1 hypothetical protein FE697_011855 [Mumia zhuanghuii]
MGVVHRRLGFAATSGSVAVLGGLAAFQVFRGSGRDLAILTCLALVALLGIGRTTPRVAVPRPSRDVGAVVLPAAAVAGLLLVATPRYAPVAVVVVSTVGLLALLVAWGPDDRLDRAVSELEPARRRPIARAATAWLGIVAVVALWQLVSYVPGPTFSDLFDPWVDDVPGRAAFVIVWLAGLCGLLRHGWRPAPRRLRQQAPAAAEGPP